MIHWNRSWLVFFLGLASLAFQSTAMSQSTSSNVPPEWQTFAEHTDYRETPRYNETVAFAGKLAAASPLNSFRKFWQKR